MTSHLPNELLMEVIKGVASQADLLRLRSADKKFRVLASPRAFRVLYVGYSLRSAMGLVNLFKSPAVAGFVQEISFKEQGPRKFGHNPDNDDEAIFAALHEALSSLKRVPNLKSLSFVFCDEALDDNEWYTDHSNTGYMHLQWTILESLSRNTLPHPSLASLTLKNMIPYMPDPSVHALYTDHAFAAFIASLHHLHVFVLKGDTGDGDEVPGPLGSFWDTILEHVIQPAVALRSLEFGTERTVGGAQIPVNFDKVHFPYLESISLEVLGGHFGRLLRRKLGD